MRLNNKKAAVRRLGVLLLLGLSGCAMSRAALWDVVDRHCVRDASDLSVCPKRAANYVLLTTNQHPPHLLLIPNVKIRGVESDAFWAPGPNNYFYEAWLERGFAAARLGGGVSPDRVGIAINSAFGRSQDQLHVHLNCVNPRVLAELSQHWTGGDGWQEIHVDSVGESYRARRWASHDLPDDPFSDFLQHYPSVASHHAEQTVFAARIDFADVGPRVVLLESEFRAGNAAYPGHAESLLSNQCA